MFFHQRGLIVTTNRIVGTILLIYITFLVIYNSIYIFTLVLAGHTELDIILAWLAITTIGAGTFGFLGFYALFHIDLNEVTGIVRIWPLGIRAILINKNRRGMFFQLIYGMQWAHKRNQPVLLISLTSEDYRSIETILQQSKTQ